MNNILKYPGSKWRLEEWIISMFPDNYKTMTYLEPYFGSGAIFFNKQRSKIETINDLDSRVVNLFRVIRDKPDDLAKAIKYTPWSREEYQLSYIDSGNSIEDARRFLVRMWQAIGGKTSDITGWSNNIKPVDSGKGRWGLLQNDLDVVTDRLKSKGTEIVQIENQKATELIERYDYPYVLMYIDPPYVLSTRSKRLYKHEMTEADHEELLKLLIKSKAKIMISGYDNDLYNDYLKTWSKEICESRTEFAGKACEVIWMNYKASKQLSF